MLYASVLISIFLASLLTSFGGHALARDLLLSAHGGSEAVNELARRHLGPTGKPCLALEGHPSSQVINKDIFEHWITATNSCGQNIKVRVCYFKTDHCMLMNVPPWQSKSAVLGIYPALREFRYESREQF